jgi:hypothetical protein
MTLLKYSAIKHAPGLSLYEEMNVLAILIVDQKVRNDMGDIF